MTNFLPYAHQSIDDADVSAVAEALRQPLITRGSIVEAFEKAICEYVEAKYAVAFSSGSAALQATFQAADVGPADRVVTSPNTFIASVSGAVRLGASLRLVDIDSFGNMDLNGVAKELDGERSRGKTVVVPVHFAGVAVDMARLDECLKAVSTIVIEDAAHALGSRYLDGSPVGNCRYSDMTVFSFHASKNITCGEGGMVTTNDVVLASRLRRLRDSGIERASVRNNPQPEPWYYEIEALSSNLHMTEGQASLGLSQLKRVDLFERAKADLVSSYRHLLQAMPALALSPAEADYRSHRHLFQVFIDFGAIDQSRTSVMEGLYSCGIGSQYHYVPLYRHPALAPALSQTADDFPQMEQHFHSALSIPFFSSMTQSHVDRVSMALRKVLFRL